MVIVRDILHFEHLTAQHNCIQVTLKLLVTEGVQRLTCLCFKTPFFFCETPFCRLVSSYLNVFTMF